MNLALKRSCTIVRSQAGRVKEQKISYDIKESIVTTQPAVAFVYYGILVDSNLSRTKADTFCGPLQYRIYPVARAI